MANPQHVAWIHEGRADWLRHWLRLRETGITADLCEADLSNLDLSELHLVGVNLAGSNLRGTSLSGANLEWSILRGADLTETTLSKANLRETDLSNAQLDRSVAHQVDFQLADLTGASLTNALLVKSNFHSSRLSNANLSGANLNSAEIPYSVLRYANLRGAELIWTNFAGSDLSGSDLSGADLEGARLTGANLKQANLTGCHVFGVAAWDLEIDKLTKQDDLIITSASEPRISVDSLEVAQFVHMMLTNSKLRDALDAITRKAVLILGRFSPERKEVLDALRIALRNRGYVSILFDFDKPMYRDLTETLSTLAHLVRFVIADLTDSKSLPQELSHIIPNLPSVPIQPLLAQGQREYGMFEHFKRYRWVLPVFEYADQPSLIFNLDSRVIAPAIEMSDELITPQG